MSKQQKILPSRRVYNKWVANETLEDFALRFTAKRARLWSRSRIANTALGTASFLVLEALGGGITLSYGFTNSFYAILVVCSLLFLTGIPIAYYSAKAGVDIDLLTRGAGFGYIGSTISSLIYASFTFIFFALEAAIMSMALHLLFGLSLPIAYILSAIIIIPLVTHGITIISRFQVWTQPLWIVLQILPFLFIMQHDAFILNDWVSYGGLAKPQDQSFDILLFGAAAAILFPLIAQIGEQVDFLRFLPAEKKTNSIGWWAALLTAGPGWVLLGVIKLFAGSLLAYIAIQQGIDAYAASDPTHMYKVAFGFVIDSPEIALIIAGLFVILCQLKINVANAYAGSLAWSNFFSRLTHYHPGRVVWLVFNVAIALILMELGIYEALEAVLQTYSALVLAWIGSIVADLVINKPLNLSPKHIEFKRSHLYDINPVGVGSMIIASSTGIAAHFGVFGELSQALSPFIALFIPFITVPIIAIATKSKYYLARDDQPDNALGITIPCDICQHTFDQEDMTFCPAYEGPICSLCCSLDSQCGDLCRPKATLSEQTFNFFNRFLPTNWLTNINPSITQFFSALVLISLVLSGLLTLVYFQTPYDTLMSQTQTAGILIKVFFLLLILFGVVIWLYVLSQQSRRSALKESQQQTQLLLEEIGAHKKTYDNLQKAKNSAETANQAKSRYLAGISHELRTPLNVVLGYAQLLEQSQDIPSKHRDSLNLIRQNGEHLTDLIEGLLEISKIEAGKLELQKDEVSLKTLLDQIADMFELQANNKGLSFEYSCSPYLPETIISDIKRLRQMLINLLSNAVKYTSSGGIKFTVTYRSQVAKFIVEDSGIGISAHDQERIFEPFERVRQKLTQKISGTGLGLAITRLLADMMSGEVTLSSEQGKGSVFTLAMLLSPIDKPTQLTRSQSKTVSGYHGDRKTLFLVDDETLHRRLLREYLEPLGFNIVEADSAQSCLAVLQKAPSVDLFILDVNMPETDGWQLAEALRDNHYTPPIIMLSANSRENHIHNHRNLHAAYHAKPVQLDQLLASIGEILTLDWIDDSNNETANSLPTTNEQNELDIQGLLELKALAEIGFLSALKDKLALIKEAGGVDNETLKQLTSQVASCNFPGLIATIDEVVKNV